MTALDYPTQDPAELRAMAVRVRFERIRLAVRRYSLIYSKYAAGQTDFKTVCTARRDLDSRIAQAEDTTVGALEDAQVPAVHERSEP